jgi:anti-anti-sigma factor
MTDPPQGVDRRPRAAPTGAPLDVRVRPFRTDTVVIEAHGTVDLLTAHVLEQVAAGQVAQGRTRILIDLTGVPMCDSTGLTALIRIHRLAGAHGGHVRLVGLRPKVRALLELTNLTRIFDVYDTVADALPEG